MRIAPPSLPPHHSGPATRDFLSSISVEALFHRCHLDVHCARPPSPTTPVLCHGPVWWSPPSGSGGGAPTHAPLQPTSPSSPLAGISVFLQSRLQSPFCLSDVDLAAAAGDTIYHIGLFTVVCMILTMSISLSTTHRVSVHTSIHIFLLSACMSCQKK